MSDKTLFISPFSSLRTKLLLLLTGLVAATLAGAGMTLWYVRTTQDMFQSLAEHDIQALFSAQGLERELMAQQGLTNYYSQDHNDAWLVRLNSHQKQFGGLLSQGRQSNYLEEGREILNSIESGYLRYIYSRNGVIALYMKGQNQQAVLLHKDIRERYQSIYDLCEQYKTLYQQRIIMTAVSYKEKAQLLTILSFSAIPVSALFAIWLGLILVKRILDPIRHLAKKEEALPSHLSGEMGALSNRMQILVDEVEHAYEMLQHKIGRAHV